MIEATARYPLRRMNETACLGMFFSIKPCIISRTGVQPMGMPVPGYGHIRLGVGSVPRESRGAYLLGKLPTMAGAQNHNYSLLFRRDNWWLLSIHLLLNMG